MKFIKILAFRSFLAALLNGCHSTNTSEQQAELKVDQYMIEGERLYQIHCENCHQSQGQGFAKLYPPIAQSDFLSDTSKVICLIKNGIDGPIVVNGIAFNMKMPSNTKLTDLEVAEISTFIYNQWSAYPDKMITTDRVSKVLNNCSGQLSDSQ